MSESENKRARSSNEANGTGTERAEELLEQFSRRVARFVSTAAARAREEAEDMWAEAQSIRRGERQ